MRFHIGFSKRISWKWLLLIGGCLLAFFGVGNNFVLAQSMSAQATATYVLSPYGAKEYCSSDGCVNYPTGNLINAQNGTPYTSTWESQRYSAFQTITSPYTCIGPRDSIFGARLRWTYDTNTMNKCDSGQAITYTFKFFLRNIGGGLPLLWKTPDLYEKFWIRSSQVNYDCTVNDIDSHVISVNCTIPNPTAPVYMYIEDFTIPHMSVIDAGYYNVGAAPVEYSCGGLDTASLIANANSNANNIIDNATQNTNTIINNNNQNTNSIVNSTTQSANSIISNNTQNTNTIINNNNQNTQQIIQGQQDIIDSATNNTDAVIGSITDSTTYDESDLPSFVIENMAISSQSQKLFMLPIQMLNAVVSGSTTCTPLTINLTSLNSMLNANVPNITIPCMGTRIKDYIGETWYNIFDILMGSIVFYYIASGIVLRIQMVMSGVDTLPSFYTSHGRTRTLAVDNATGEVVG